MTNLPSDQLKAELARLSRLHNRHAGDGELTLTRNAAGQLCLRVAFPDGMAWEVPFDPESQDIIQAQDATKH